MALLEMPSTCEDDGTKSWTCATVYHWTGGNESLSHAAEWLIGKPAAVVGLIVFAVVIRWVAHRMIDRVVRRAEEGVLPTRLSQHNTRVNNDEPQRPAQSGSTRRVQRAKSLGSLMKSLSSGVIFGVVFVMCLSEIGVNVAPILASAGVLGLAIGFGAQTLVKDYLSGVFMIFEDQYGVGDTVDLGEASGTVEAVGLRVTRLRDVDGTVWYVRNGEILRVGNQSQNWSRTVLDISVAYSEDLTRVRRVLMEVAHDVWENKAFKGQIIEEPEVWGVQALGPDGVVVRVVLKTAPSAQWGVAREMRERIKDRFDAERIEIPFPQQMVWNRDAPRRGTAGEPASSEGVNTEG